MRHTRSTGRGCVVQTEGCRTNSFPLRPSACTAHYQPILWMCLTCTSGMPQLVLHTDSLYCTPSAAPPPPSPAACTAHILFRLINVNRNINDLSIEDLLYGMWKLTALLLLSSFRKGSVIVNFTIHYSEISSDEIVLLKASMDETGKLGFMPVQLLNISSSSGMQMTQQLFFFVWLLTY